MKTKREIKAEIKGLEQKRHILDCQIVEIDSRLETLNEALDGMHEDQLAMVNRINYDVEKFVDNIIIDTEVN